MNVLDFMGWSFGFGAIGVGVLALVISVQLIRGKTL